MTLAELMADFEPSESFAGENTTDDFVLAVNTSGTPDAEVSTYAVAQTYISGLDAQLNPTMVDKNYIRAGQSSTKTGTQRTFTITGDRYTGDDFQDFAMSHKIKYGTGQAVIVDYVYFSLKTGKGEKGKATLLVNSDGSGNAGESAGISIELRKSGAAPEEYTYA